jgi:hypothetical protein
MMHDAAAVHIPAVQNFAGDGTSAARLMYMCEQGGSQATEMKRVVQVDKRGGGGCGI